MTFKGKCVRFVLVLLLFCPLRGSAAESSQQTAASEAENKTSAPSIPLGPLVTVKMLDWGNYIVELEPELQKFLKKSGSNVKIEYVKPQLSTARDLLSRLSRNNFDLATPSISFFGQEPSLKKSFASFDFSPAVSHPVPDILRTEGSMCIPIYGGFMSVFTKGISEPVNDFAIFESPSLKGFYALPNQEPWFIAYLVYQLLNTSSAERFTKSSLESLPFRNKYKKLIANAGLVYSHYDMSVVDLSNMKLLYGFGYRVPSVWKPATQIKKLPYYMDCLAITPSAAQDGEKRKFFRLMQYWILSKFGQNLVTQKIEGTFNMTATTLDINGLYTGLDSEKMKILSDLHSEALAGRARGQ